MHITKIELEDIKSHRSAKFEFERGTTAITGENGAGKTTIIEAVAWTLFDLLDYKKEDFARRGSKKGTARVSFLSGLDEREYTIYRDTGTGYYVYDNQLKMRIAEKKEEVKRFLWQHLGVEAGTDLESLFRRAIGVPQGTFTAIFLETAAERKKAFDKLLKVEEYQQGAQKLLETTRYVENQINLVNQKIARAEGELARFDSVEIEHQTYVEQSVELIKTVKNLTREVAEKSEIVKTFETIETKVNALRVARDKLQAEKQTAQILQKQKEYERTQAFEAAEKIKLVEADYKIHTAALTELKNLEARRSERDKIRAELNKIENRIVSLEAEQKSCSENLKKVADARENIVKIEPQVREQEDLEKRREILRGELADAKAADSQVASYEGKLKILRDELAKINSDIKLAEEKSAGAENFDFLQTRDTEITRELAKLRAEIERDAQLEREIVENLFKNKFCPILSQTCLNLETGKAWKNYEVAKNGHGKSQIAVLETEQKNVSVNLDKARQAQISAAVLPTLLENKQQTTERGKRIREEQESWRKKAENLVALTAKFSEIETEIKNLANPKAKLLAFETEIRRESELKEKLVKTEENLTVAQTEKTHFDRQLSEFETLDAEWKHFSDERDRTANAQREFLANETLAKTLSMRESELENTLKEVVRLEKESAKATEDFETASKDYDRERHQNEKNLLFDAERKLVETRANLENAQKHAARLAEELEHLAAIRVAMRGEFQEKERLEKIGEATKFIRDTLKEAAPRVARNYVFLVSSEANQMFREITGNAERTLKWTEDYGIVLEENGYERPFVNLSGGEQMSAALSVRLALLKQLSDVRLAFFDEPTTNMDAERRERLAEQISHITEKQTFDQLFVISHDDTFESFADNVVLVGRNVNE